MASGIASPWGYSPEMVAGLNNPMELGNTHLTGQLGLTSTPVVFDKNNMISPLMVANKSFYKFPSFGKKKSKISLRKVNADISYLKQV
jgi:hypothetical protein